MNAAETIQAAIEKLEDLRDGATPGLWAYYNEPWGDIMSEQEPGLGVETTVAAEMSDFDGNLVVVLHRTIDAQLEILQHALARATSKIATGGNGRSVWSHESDAENLARAILGVVS